MRIYVVGNPLVVQDSAALSLVPKLRKRFPRITFVPVDPNEDFPPDGEKNLILMDTVRGILKPIQLTLEDLEPGGKTPVSPHDYDLLMHLLLLRKMGKVENITILGVPADTGVGIWQEVAHLIESLSHSI